MLESLLGAIYLDAGLPAAQAFVARLLRASQHWAQVFEAAADHKSQLARLVAASGRRGRPAYHTRAVLRPYQDGQRLKLRWWRSQVVLNGQKLSGHAGGWSRQAAEQDAARQALEALGEPPPQPASA